MRVPLEAARVRSLYDAVASHYDRRHALLTLGADQRGRHLLVREAVFEGAMVLDVGGGTGSAALLAAARAGPQGKAVVLDTSELMLGVARARARAAGLEGRLEMQCGDIQALPFPDGTFDAVIAAYSLDPVADPVAAARELYRVLRRGGRLGVAHSTWPRSRPIRWLAAAVESFAWKFPSLSMGCRPIAVLPALRDAGARLITEQRLGVPLWPILAFVVEKPG